MQYRNPPDRIAREKEGSARLAAAARCALRVIGAVAVLGLVSGCDTLSARFRAREGIDLYRQADYSGAAKKFEEAHRLDPALPVLLLNAGTSNLAVFRAVGRKTPEGQGAATRAISSYE